MSEKVAPPAPVAIDDIRAAFVPSLSRHSLLAAATALIPDIRVAADEIETGRRVPEHLVKKLLRAGILRMPFPPYNADLLTRFEVTEIMAYANASVGWITMLEGGHGGGPRGAGSTPPEVIEDAEGVIAGAARPSGKATRVKGGYRVTGQWPFMSGCDHATYYSGACVVQNGNGPQLDDNGRPAIINCFFSRDQVEIVDTWHALGLRGSGSNDVKVVDAFVPDDRVYVPGTVTAEFDHILDWAPGLLMIFHAPIALGIGRHAIELLTELANTKMGARGTPMRREAQVQAAIARAEALVGSSRAYVFDVLNDIAKSFAAGEELTFKQRALCRLSTTHVHKACTEAVDLLFEIGGGSCVYSKSGMERLFRDMHVANQHIAVDYKTYEFAGRMLMGMNPGEPMF